MPNDSGFVPRPGRNDVAEAALLGLTASPKTLPPRLFYDDEGCRLFYEITTLPEYYLTRTEMTLLTGRTREMVPPDLHRAALVEFGGSTEDKARPLLDLLANADTPVFGTYVPIDIAEVPLAAMQRRLNTSHPHLRVIPVVADFLQPIRLPELASQRLGFFPGSTIGNLDPDVAVDFLAGIRTALGQDSWLLLGADLRKDAAILLPAYNDAAGVTAAFNLNLLTRLNREAAATFDPAGFSHKAVWNDPLSRIEMHLISQRDQMVSVAGRPIAFRLGETIHTENSYKHSPSVVIDLAGSAGWKPQGYWTDPGALFGLFLFQAGYPNGSARPISR